MGESIRLKSLTQEFVVCLLMLCHIWYRLAESSLDALTNMATHPETHKYPSTCLRLLGKLLPLQQIIQVRQHRDFTEGGNEVSPSADGGDVYGRIL
jgi:hypothetical protein